MNSDGPARCDALDAAEAENARMKPVVEAAEAWHRTGYGADYFRLNHVTNAYIAARDAAGKEQR